MGAADHPVSCLNYGDDTVASAQGRTLSDTEITRTQQALALARALVNPRVGILGVATGKSIDNPGEGAVILYVDEIMQVGVPVTIAGVRTMVIPTNGHAVAFGAAPVTPFISSTSGLTAAALGTAEAMKRQVGPTLMKRNPAFFGIGVGQSLDSPRSRPGYLCRPQAASCAASRHRGWHSRPVCGDGPAPCNTVLCVGGTVEPPLHAAQDFER